MFIGGYPRIYQKNITPSDFYASYIATYAERDVRQIAHIQDLEPFKKCMKLCAGRVGQLLNYQDIAVNCGVDHRTIKKWIKVLQESYILFSLSPKSNNFNTQTVKSPKMYFYDTGLLCNLL